MLINLTISSHHQNNQLVLVLNRKWKLPFKDEVDNKRTTATRSVRQPHPPPLLVPSLFVDCQNRIANQAHKGWLSCSRKPKQTAMLRPLQLGCHRTLKRQHHHLPLCPLMKLNNKRRSMTTRGSMWTGIDCQCPPRSSNDSMCISPSTLIPSVTHLTDMRWEQLRRCESRSRARQSSFRTRRSQDGSTCNCARRHCPP